VDSTNTAFKRRDQIKTYYIDTKIEKRGNQLKKSTIQKRELLKQNLSPISPLIGNSIVAKLLLHFNPF